MGHIVVWRWLHGIRECIVGMIGGQLFFADHIDWRTDWCGWCHWQDWRRVKTGTAIVSVTVCARDGRVMVMWLLVFEWGSGWAKRSFRGTARCWRLAVVIVVTGARARCGSVVVKRIIVTCARRLGATAGVQIVWARRVGEVTRLGGLLTTLGTTVLEPDLKIKKKKIY